MVTMDGKFVGIHIIDSNGWQKMDIVYYLNCDG